MTITDELAPELTGEGNAAAAVAHGPAEIRTTKLANREKCPQPSIAELEAHMGQTESKDEANSDESLVIEPQGQWI